MALSNGFVKPVFYTTDDYGNLLAGYTEDDLRRIHRGENCWNCGEPFRVMPVKCPVCKTAQMELPTNVPQPEEWK